MFNVMEMVEWWRALSYALDCSLLLASKIQARFNLPEEFLV